MKKCPDCKGDFEKGCLIDFGYASVTVQRFARSDVKDTKSLVMGINEEKFYDVRKVITYRCIKCNRLFSYALNTVLVSDANTRTKKVLYITLWIFALLFVAIVFSILMSV